MGKCISKQPSTSLLAIEHSEKDLATDKHFWSKYAATSTEYIAIQHEQVENQLCEHNNNKNKNSNSIADRKQNDDTGDEKQQRHGQQQQQNRSQQDKQHNANNNKQQMAEQLADEVGKNDEAEAEADADAADDDDDAADDNNDEEEQLVLSKNQVGICKIRTKMNYSGAAIDQADHITLAKVQNTEATTNSMHRNYIATADADDDEDNNAIVVVKHVGCPAKNLGNITNNDTNDGRHCLAHLSLFPKQQNHKQQQQQQQQHHQKYHNENLNQGSHEICLTTKTTATATATATTKAPSANSNIVESVNKANTKKYKNKQNQQQQQQEHQKHSQQQKAKKFHKLIPNKVTTKNLKITTPIATKNELYEEKDVEQYICPNSIHCKQIGGNLLCQHSEDIIFLHISTDFMGQTESKKSAKKYSANSVETKGTAMSFGFRKKLNSTPKKLKKLLEGSDMKHKKQDKCNNPTINAQDDDKNEIIGTVISNDTIRDDNGNAAETLSTIYFEKMGAVAAAATTATNTIGKPTVKATNGNQGVTMGEHLPGANNRFGFRGCSVPRPASAGTTTRHYQTQQQQQQLNDARDNIDNNNCSLTENLPKGSLVSNLKRRSKSANTGRTLTLNKDEKADGTMAPKINQPRTITFNLNQNTTIEYQRRQFFEHPTTTDTSYGRFVNQVNSINTGMHTNVIVRPTPRTALASYSKFTLQTVSLPRPEFPVAISLTATTPTTPSSTFSPTKTPTTTTTTSSSATASTATGTAPSGSGARAKDVAMTQHGHSQHPLTLASQPAHFDQKSVKQMTNNSTRRGFSGSREISADSGIASMDMALESISTPSSGMSKRQASPKRSRSRPRHLQMVMNGRHKFEVRELDDPLSSESSSCVEPLSLPKLPAENQTMPLPLCGLIRSNTVLSRESYERKNNDTGNSTVDLSGKYKEIVRNPSEESESIDEEKLYLDFSTSEKSAKQRQFRDINTCSSKTSSPGSSIMLSWCNAGESLAIKDCSSLSISSSDDSNKQANKQNNAQANKEQQGVDLTMDPIDDDNSLINTDMQVSTISSITETQTAPQKLNDNFNFNDNKLEEHKMQISEDDVDNMNSDRPRSFLNALNEAKFAEIALAGSKYLLDDETSPTDSLVSSPDSDDAGGGSDKLKKHKFNEELQEKDIDEISPELEVGSPISPGTPTHASRSLSFSECGNLIDDEIADQPALLFNNDSNQDSSAGIGAESHKDKTDTPTLIETPSMRSLKSQPKTRTPLQQAIELTLRTPISVRKALMERVESLDTLSPCESICSDDLMMDFETNSSIDSIDRSVSIKSRSGSDLNKIDETNLFAELDRRGSDVMKELNTLLKVRSDRKSEKENVTAQLPARATRLLNRSRLQQQCPLNNVDSDSSKSPQSLQLRSSTGSRSSTRSTPTKTSAQQFHIHHHNSVNHTLSPLPQKQQSQQYQRLQKRDTHSSSDDLMLYDKSFRNAMIQDVLQFKKQLLRLRRILQETETLNPFENDNGQLFASCGLDSKQLDDIDLASLTSSTTNDPMQELADLRRQVVYLQGQVDDRDRTIRLQRNLIEKLEAEKSTVSLVTSDAPKECITIATQTERTRPPAIGAEGLSRSKPEFTSYTTYFPALYCNDATKIMRHHQQYPGGNALNQTRRHTVISATLTNYNHQNQNQIQHQHNHHHYHHPHHHSTNNLNQQLAATTFTATAASAKTNGYMPRRASIAWETQASSKYQPTTITTTATTATTKTSNPIPASAPTPTPATPQYKPVRITLIGEPISLIKGTTAITSTTNTNTITNTTTTTTSLSENEKNLIMNSNNYNNNNNNNNSSSSGRGSNNNNNTRQFDCKNNFINSTTNDLLLTNNLNNNNNNNISNINHNNNISNINNNNNINCKAHNGYTKVRLSSDNLQKYNFNDFDKQLQQQEQHKQQHQHQQQQLQQQQQQMQQTQQQFHSNYNNYKSDKSNPTVTIV